MAADRQEQRRARRPRSRRSSRLHSKAPCLFNSCTDRRLARRLFELRRTLTAKIALVKPIVANGVALLCERPCSTTAPPPSPCSKPAARARPRDWSRPGPTRRGAGAHPDHRRAHARPWQAVAVALRHRRPTTSATRSPTCSPARFPSMIPTRPPAHYAKALRVRPPGAGAGRARLGARPRATRSRCGSRNCRCGAAAMNLLHRRPCAGLSSAAGSPAGRPIRSGSAPPSASRASGSPASSSSARPGSPLEERPRPPLATVVRHWAAAGKRLNLTLRFAVLSQHDASNLPRKARLRPPARGDRRRDPRRPISATAIRFPRSARLPPSKAPTR